MRSFQDEIESPDYHRPARCSAELKGPVGSRHVCKEPSLEYRPQKLLAVEAHGPCAPNRKPCSSHSAARCRGKRGCSKQEQSSGRSREPFHIHPAPLRNPSSARTRGRASLAPTNSSVPSLTAP